MNQSQQKTILLGITGGIAAYKICDLARQLVRAGHKVKVVMTAAATQFVGPATFRALTNNPVATELFDDPAAPINHINLAEEADLMLIAPATANVIAKLTHGRADDLLTTTALAFQGRLLIAPAMNTQMYLDPATQANLKTLEQRGVTLIGPATGQLACGDSGPGRMVEADELFDKVAECVHSSTLLAGKKVLISAGPTREYLDPVRYLSNRSSGKMGLALAREALRAGAGVQLVLGPVTEPVPVDPHLTRRDVVSAEDMHACMTEAAPKADLIICTAAVSDYRPSEYSSSKIKKPVQPQAQSGFVAPVTLIAPIVSLTENPDILAGLGQMKVEGKLRSDAVIVGFAAETDNMEASAAEKLERKGADFLVANDVSATDIGFESEQNAVTIFGKTAVGVDVLRRLEKSSKTLIARQILETVYPRG
ncbi:MAG: bifunctional phosphopantothenoylcysteine decarboxylase/phosphopantothenate--cysteine ligase CoaBC [Coriobacteriia bacterium]|nr:bifunctional phosphopantothenoylcysteine decarboxylase/phosphopantothenate--cysteine ligase CoaBC [Coriobacteriia bacterium]MCL2537249.1 bifunctional phosphopantothenoylcysteine decarboxylase/phosphopantothenate--cysteine ligase CoaBC [Coriobacteriia bacterium]